MKIQLMHTIRQSLKYFSIVDTPMMSTRIQIVNAAT